jgi:hypothetical protein
MRIILVLLILTVSVLFYSFEKEQVACSSVITYSNEKHQYSGVPPAGKTGAPNEGICFNCHSVGVLNGSTGNVLIEFNGGINFYKPDSTYTISVMVKEVGSTAFGFESTILDSNTIKAGSFSILDSSKTAYQALLGREYLSHNSVWSNLSNDSIMWQFKWTAPSVNAGVLTIYAASVANPGLISIAIGNVYNDSLKIYPDPSITAVNEISISKDVLIYPNPAKKYITINTNNKSRGSVVIYDLKGTVVKEYILKNSYLNNYNIEDLEEGIYLLEYRSTTNNLIKKIIKIDE